MLHDHARTGSNAAASPGWQNVHRSIVYIGYSVHLYDIDKSGSVQLEENKRVG